MKLIKKILYKNLTYAFYPIAFFIVIIIRLISPFYLIRWNCTISTRIGHYVENMNVYLSEKDVSKNKIKVKHFDIFYDREKICNEQVQKMLRRKVFFLPWFIMHPINTLNEFFFDKIYDSKRKHEIGYYREVGKVEKYLVAPLSSFDNLNSQDEAKIQLFFTQNEINEGEKNLKKIGINPENQIVSIILRDKDYLKRNYKEINSDHHSHRDTDLSFYEESIEYLIKKNIKVIVFGSKKERLKSENLKKEKNVFFYEEIDIKSDLMNIYILYKSKFVISSVTGLDSVPAIFKIPIIEVGFVPFALQRTYSNLYLSMFKNYYSKTLNRCLTMSEIFENDLHNIHGDSDLRDEIEFIHPSKEDILNSCIEMFRKIDSNYVSYNSKDQRSFRELYNFYINKYYPQRSVLVNYGTIAEDFLNKNKFILN